MGNLLSIHAEIFLKKNSKGLTLSPVEIMTKLLENLNGRSYNGYPFVLKEHWNGKTTSYRVSYGDKMEPRSLIHFYEKNAQSIEQIFARTFDETGDWDWMISFPNDSNDYYQMRRKCKYSFDMIKFKSNDGYSFKEIKGTFNSKSDLNQSENRNLVNTPIEYLDSLKTYAELEIETDENDGLSKILNESKHIIFMDKGITVHQKIGVDEYRKMGFQKNLNEFMAIKYNDSMYDIYSGGWSNCADAEYLLYTQ